MLGDVALFAGRAGIDGGAPLGAIFLAATAYYIEVKALDGLADGTDLASADGTVVDLDDGSDLRAGAAEEDLVGNIEFGAVYLPFAGDETQFAPRKLHDGVASHAEQDIFRG